MRIRKLAPSGRVEGRWLCHLEDGTILRLRISCSCVNAEALLQVIGSTSRLCVNAEVSAICGMSSI